MKISFDIDGTLDNRTIIDFYWWFYMMKSKLSHLGLFIITNRLDVPEQYKNIVNDKTNVYLLGVLDNAYTKLDILLKEEINIHFDDNEFEVAQINNYAKEHNLNLTAVLVNYNGKVDDN